MINKIHVKKVYPIPIPYYNLVNNSRGVNLTISIKFDGEMIDWAKFNEEQAYSI